MLAATAIHISFENCTEPSTIQRLQSRCKPRFGFSGPQSRPSPGVSPHGRTPESIRCGDVHLSGDFENLSEQHILDRFSKVQATACVRVKARGLPTWKAGSGQGPTARKLPFWGPSGSTKHSHKSCVFS